MKKYLKNKKGITLISLITTIIILIILAGISITLALGNNGIFNKGKEAKEETNKQTATEKINLKITTAQMNSYSEKQQMPTLKELSLVLKEDKEIDYVTEQSQIASTKYEVGEAPSSIYTKLKEYPYEFEIDSALRLASINGIKIGQTDTVTIPKEEYEQLKTKVENIGKMYKKTNVVNINTTGVWTDLKDAKWNFEKGTWLVDLSISSIRGGSGLFAYQLKGVSFIDCFWKSDSNYCTKHTSTIISVDKETEVYFSYYKSITTATNDAYLILNAVKLSD